MANNTQFSIAVHLMAGLACRCEKDTTSAFLAMSVNTSPSFVRRVLAKLSKAGLVETATGKAGAPIPVGAGPVSIAVGPAGKTVYVANFNDGSGDTVTPISTATNKAGQPILVGPGATGIAISSAGATSAPVSCMHGSALP